MVPPSVRPARDPDDWSWIFDPRQSLRARAVLIFGGLSLAFVVLLGWSGAALFRRHLTQQLGPAFETLAFQIGDKLDRALDERLRALQLAASLAPLRSPTTPLAEKRALLDTLLETAPDCAWLGFADSRGRVVSATQRVFEGTAVETGAWFLGGRRQPYVGQVHEIPELARTLPNPTGEVMRFLDLALPVNESDGNFLGVLGAHLRWSWARDTQVSVVPDAARRKHLSVTIYSPTGEVLLDSGASGWTRPPDAPVVGERPGTRGFTSESVAGDSEYLSGYARSRGYREFRGTNWLVVVRQPVADAFAPTQDFQRWIVRLGSLFVAIIVGLSWWVAGRFARRMRAVTSAAHRIRGGDILSLMPRPDGQGELQTMCAALGKMVDDFRQQQETRETGQVTRPPANPANGKS